VAASVESRTQLLDSLFHDLHQIDRILFQGNLPEADTRNIQQIIDEADLLPQLSLDHRLCPLLHRCIGATAPDLKPIADRHQWIP
jgi:hypothetical protein